MAGIASIIGAAAGFAGRKPDYSGIPAPYVDLSGAQKRAAKSNIGALPDLEKLASEVDSFSTGELLKRLEQFSPGIGKVISKIPSILESEVSGTVPDDVLRAIKRGVGSQAWASGLSPGQRTSLTAEDIGKTSYALQQEGISAASRWMAQVESGAPRFDFTRMFITPAMEAEQEWRNQTAATNRAIGIENINAMPSPLDNEIMGMSREADKTGQQVIGMFLGGAGSGGVTTPGWNYAGDTSSQVNNMAPMSSWGGGGGGGGFTEGSGGGSSL